MITLLMRASIFAGIFVSSDGFSTQSLQRKYAPSKPWSRRGDGLIKLQVESSVTNPQRVKVPVPALDSLIKNSEQAILLLNKHRIDKSWHRREPDPSRRNIVYVLRQLSRTQKSSDAYELLKYMIIADDESLRPDVLCLNIALKAMREQGTQAFQLLQDWQSWYKEGVVPESADVVSYNTVLAALVYNPVLAEELFEDLTQSALVEPDDVSYATLLRAHASQGNVMATETLLDGMKSSKVQPTSACYDQVLYAYSQAGQPKLALEFLDSWKAEAAAGDHNVPHPRADSYNIVLNVFSRDDLDRARIFFNNMPIRDACSYTTVIRAYCRELVDGAYSLEQISDIIDEAYEDQRIKLDSDFISNAIFSLSMVSGATAAATQLAEQLTARAVDDTLPLDIKVYNALIHCWAKSVDVRASTRVLEILREVEEAPHLRPNTKTYVSVLDCLARSKNRMSTKHAEALVQSMEKDRSKPSPNVQAYTSLIQNYARSRSPYKASQAFRVLERMKKKGNAAAEPNIITYNSALNAAEFTDASDNVVREEALRLACVMFDDFRRRNLKPDHVTYGSFLGCLANLMPKDSAQREEIVSLIFRRCAAQGLVSRLVLKKLQGAVATPGEYQTLLNNKSVDDLPRAWTCNVKDFNARKFRKS